LELQRLLKPYLSDRDRRFAVLLASLFGMAGLATAGQWLPVVYPLGLAAVAMIWMVANCFRPSRGVVSVLWVGPQKQLRAVPQHRLIFGVAALLLLVAIANVLLGRSGRVFTVPTAMDELSISARFTGLLAWGLPGLIALFIVRLLGHARRNPARTVRPTLHIVSLEPRATVQQCGRVLKRHGWRVRASGAAPQPGDLHIELTSAEKSEAFEFQPAWPLKLSLADLGHPDVLHRLRRHLELRLRKRIIKRTRRLFEHVLSKRGSYSGGYWFAPQWWFVSGLGKEVVVKHPRRSFLRRVGPTYETLYGTSARRQLYTILRAVQIDVIYVDAGVPALAVLRVLRQVFEVYDIFDGAKVVDDHSFRHVPKVRVTIHDFEPDLAEAETFGSSKRKRLKVSELSRGRILHIFRDRGKDEAEEYAPQDVDYAPTPLMR